MVVGTVTYIIIIMDGHTHLWMATPTFMVSWSSSEGSDAPIILDHGFSRPIAAYMLNLNNVKGA